MLLVDIKNEKIYSLLFKKPLKEREYLMLTSKVIRILERNYKNIGTLPTVISSLMTVLDNPRSSTRDIANIIQADQVLSARLLRLVNSAHYGLRQEVLDIQHAVGLVGYNVMRSFTFCITLFDSVFAQSSSSSNFSKEDLWFHSLAVAATTRHIAKKIGQENPPDFFVTGLLHDIGKVFTYQFMQHDFFMVVEKAHREEITFYNAEKQILTTTHAEIGAWIMTQWKLPSILVDCVRLHHPETPINIQGRVLWHEIIALADCLVKHWQIGSSGDKTIMYQFKDLLTKYRLNDNWLRSIYDQVLQEIEMYSDVIVKKKCHSSRC